MKFDEIKQGDILMIYEYDIPIIIIICKIKEVSNQQINLEKHRYSIRAKSLSFSKHTIEFSKVGKEYWEKDKGPQGHQKAKHLIEYKEIQHFLIESIFRD